MGLNSFLDKSTVTLQHKSDFFVQASLPKGAWQAQVMHSTGIHVRRIKL